MLRPFVRHRLQSVVDMQCRQLQRNVRAHLHQRVQQHMGVEAAAESKFEIGAGFNAQMLKQDAGKGGRGKS